LLRNLLLGRWCVTVIACMMLQLLEPLVVMLVGRGV
jgi:hypothetical protein